MKSHDEPIPRNKNRKRDNKKPKSVQADADPSEDGRNYGLDRMNLGETAQESESNSKLLLAQSGEIQREIYI